MISVFCLGAEVGS